MRLLTTALALAALAGSAAAEEREAPSTVDVDLAALGLDPSAPTFDDKLQLYGFADFSYVALHSEAPLIGKQRTFGVGNLNVYLAKPISPRWRTLTEVRLLFAPNGAMNPDGSLVSTSVTDAANIERPVSWGGISIERAYLEYDVHPNLTIRAGRWLTPYGIWNIDHGSPTIISVGRPYTIGEQLFPERQTGVQLLGSKRFGDYKLSYAATVSNGRNPFEATRDPDRRLGFGGRLALSAPLAGQLDVGVSAYAGRALELAPIPGVPAPAYDEVAYAADVQWKRGGLHIQGEAIAQRRRYLAGQQQLSLAGTPVPDGTAWGAYLLAGYRFERWWNVMPFVFVEDYHPFDRGFLGDYVLGGSAGLNFRPLPSVVLKAQYSYVPFDPDSGAFANTRLQVVSGQAAWVF